MVRGVERDKFLHRHFRQLRGDFDVDVGRCADGGEIRPVGNARNIEFGKGARIAENIFQRLQLGNIIACFLRHGKAQVVGRQILCPVLVDRPRHGALAPVVGSQRQMPVTVHFVDRLQIVERCRRRGDDIAPLILPPVLVEVIAFAGGRDELPQAGRLGARKGRRIEGALDHRQQSQFHRHATLFQFLDDVVHEGRGASHHASQVIRAVHIPLLMVEHEVVVDVGHGKAEPDALKNIVAVADQIDRLDGLARRRQFNFG